jgi:hypothetical protein
MTKPIYEEHTSEMGYKSIKRTDPDGTIWWIPSDPANSDYQAYLKRDEPQVEHLTEIPTP